MNFASFDLNLLRVLDALLREGSTVKAAERLRLSQPAVSSALARLRHATGEALFVRHGNRLVPTSHAEALQFPLREHLDGLEALLAGPGTFDPAAAGGTFRIAASDFFAVMLMPALADRLRKAAPRVCAQLVDLFPSDYVESIERYRADLALIPDLELPGWACREPLFRSSFRVIARRGHPALIAAGVAPGGTVPMHLFCELGHVLFSPEGKLTSISDAALARVGRSRHVVMTLPVFSGVCRAVAASDLVAVVPRQLGEHTAAETAVDVYRAPVDIATSVIIGVWHRRTLGSPFHAWMREQVFDLLRPLDAGEAEGA